MARPSRKKRIVIALLASSFLLLCAPSNPFILDGTYEPLPQLPFGMQPGEDEDLLNLIIADDYSADPRFKPAQIFWDIYRGDDTDVEHNWKRFNFTVSKARVIVENAIALLEMKWRFRY